MADTLLLIDANSLVHRAFHALPPLTTPSGEPSGALYGLASVMLKLCKEQRPTYIAAFFDRREPTFREKLFADYKAHRPPTADALIPQLQEAPALFDQFGVKTFSEIGFEADDLIGTFVEHFKKTPDLTIVILSGDRDLLQLVDNDRVVLQYMRKGITDFVLYRESVVREEYGLSPRAIPDLKGLIGDMSDNIPGVRGIGPKTAAELLKTYGSLEAVFKHVAELSPSVQKKLSGQEQVASLSKNLATIHTVAQFPNLRLADLTLRSLDPRMLVGYFERFGFESLRNRLSAPSNTLL